MVQELCPFSVPFLCCYPCWLYWLYIVWDRYDVWLIKRKMIGQAEKGPEWYWGIVMCGGNVLRYIIHIYIFFGKARTCLFYGFSLYKYICMCFHMMKNSFGEKTFDRLCNGWAEVLLKIYFIFPSTH